MGWREREVQIIIIIIVVIMTIKLSATFDWTLHPFLGCGAVDQGTALQAGRSRV
jgi:DNA repair photolyase